MVPYPTFSPLSLRRLGPLLAMLSLVLGSAVQAQDQTETVDDVVVEGIRRNEAAAFDFLRAISSPPLGAHTMAVWTTPICLSIENLTPEPTTVLTERVLARAGNLGLATNTPGCRPNIIVIFSADAHATADDLVKRNQTLFRPTTGPTQLERPRLRRYVETDRPVRWWSVWLPVDIDTGDRTVVLRGETGPPPRRPTRGMQPRGANVRDALQMSFVVVDAEKASGTSLEALGDYLAMVVLSQVDAEADVRGQPSILALFEPGSTVTRLSRWDEDYLRALYSTSAAFDTLRFQQQAIARNMVKGTDASP